MDHSPTPWTFAPEGGKQFRNEIVDANGTSITNDENYYPSAPMDDDMAFIVEAVNFYAAHLAEQSTSRTRTTAEELTVKP